MHLEDMGKYNPNMQIDVLISTAGEGTRLRKVNSEINKSLLPYMNKPIIYHIIEKIPSELKIGVLLGYKSEQVKDFLTLAYPDREFIYIYVDDWTSSNSGTKYSLLFARKLLRNSFWYFPCDGIYENTSFLLEEFSEDVFLVCKIDNSKAHHYLTFILDGKRILKQFFKSTKVAGDYAFTGVMKIISKDKFFSRLEKSNSKEFISIIPEKSLVYLTKDWKDFGNSEIYEEEISKTEGFDFSKTGEYTYQLNEMIVKWWSNPIIAKNKLEKPRIKQDVFPKNIKSLNQFLSYSKAPGSSFYENVNQKNFIALLDWLKTELWSPIKMDITGNLVQFYKNKTLARLDLLGDRKLGKNYNPKNINGIDVKPWQHYFENIQWDILTQKNEPAIIHGDLQFDNIIYNHETNKFILIDWRYDFSGLKLGGDLYYDFAKMLGGIFVNYQDIKKGKFEFNCENGNVRFEVPVVNEKRELIEILESYADKIGLDITKVRELVPLIFWNMAPLHKEPFSDLCWSLGILHYEMLNR